VITSRFTFFEGLFLFNKEKEPKRQDTKVSKLSGKKTVTGQNSGKLYKEAPMGQFLIFRSDLTEFAQSTISQLFGVNFSVKKTE